MAISVNALALLDTIASTGADNVNARFNKFGDDPHFNISFTMCGEQFDILCDSKYTTCGAPFEFGWLNSETDEWEVAACYDSAEVLNEVLHVCELVVRNLEERKGV